RCAVMLWSSEDSSVICASRSQGWRVAPANGRKAESFWHPRAAQERTARRAVS
ncbi:hypothetical protein A2U01_0076551, partial [Trifolium medium]|nr:hypothetical protein [Trifolium medium]